MWDSLAAATLGGRATFVVILDLSSLSSIRSKIIACHRRTTGCQCGGLCLPWPCEAGLTSADDPLTVRGGAAGRAAA